VPTTPNQLFAFLDTLGITHTTVEHPPFFTVEDGDGWWDKIPGLHCKNLFLKDKKNKLWLVVMPGDRRADLKRIAKNIGATNPSFGNPSLLMDVLGLSPGSVTPFALMNDGKKLVTIVLDREMLTHDYVNYHPLHNAASTTIKSADLITFIHALDYKPIIVDCGAA
jgi:Ala-tRNA(Pro) deacylase